MTGPPKGNAVTRFGPGTAQEGHRNKNSAANITHLPVLQRLHPGIGAYRQQRSPGEAYRAIRVAIYMDTWLTSETGVHTAPEVLEGVSEWISQGAVPS